MKKKLFPLAIIVLLASCTKEEIAENFPGTGHDAIPMQVKITQPDLFPEGVVYDKFNKRFYVSSVRRGDIGIVNPDGTYQLFIDDPALTATTGLEIDAARKLLFVSNTPGSVGIYDIRTGNRTRLINLAALLPGAPIFINDIALDPKGNAYVTNSLSPVIYKISTDGTASIFFQNADFATAPGQFGFNGIEYGENKGGYLLVAFTQTGQLVKIPVSNRSPYQVVALNAPLARPDGLLLGNDGKALIVVNNAGGAEGRVTLFTSKDNWQKGTLLKTYITGPVFPTTATTNGQDVFVLYAYLNRQAVGQPEFQIQKIPF